MELIRLEEHHLPDFLSAVKLVMKDQDLMHMDLDKLYEEAVADPARFIREQDDPLGLGADIEMPDGTFVKRLPSIVRHMWDGEICGRIGFRWSPGTNELPPTCLGHIGYWILPHKRRKGYAAKALGLMLEEARAQKLDYVDLTTDPENLASQAVIKANGGVFRERVPLPPQHGSGDITYWRIKL
jgi:hypothetical protein